MKKLAGLLAALLIAGSASAQTVVRSSDDSGRVLFKSDGGRWAFIRGNGVPSFSTFGSENVPEDTLYIDEDTGIVYYYASSAWVASGGSLTPGTTTVGSSTDCFAFADASSKLQCDNTLAKLDNSGAGNGAAVFRKTTPAATGDAASTPFLSVTGTFTQSTSGGLVAGARFSFTPVGTASVVQDAIRVLLNAGYTGAAYSAGVHVNNSIAGTGTAYIANFTTTSNAPNDGVYGASVATSTGSRVGVRGYASGGDYNAGGVFQAQDAKNGAMNVGLFALGRNTGTTPVYAGAYVGLIGYSQPTIVNSALQINNSDQAAPLIVAQDNGAALPTTGATATWQVADGAWPQLGNGVLTSGTMTAETQARMSGSQIHSYTWTNAQVVALGATTAGDISVATLPAKTVVKNAYVVITGQGAGTTTLTVACGRTGATYIDYIVASDAKAAANTVYGDASAERGTNLTGYDLPSYTGTTAVNCHFISTGANLSAVTGSTGRVILETALVP